MIVSIASGKGGTGKTSVAVNMAISLEGDIQLLDCDVEEPNTHLLLHPKIIREEPVYSLIPSINERLCDHCGRCAKFCSYNALFVTPKEVLVFQELCHGCGGCILVCPKEAISEGKHKIGKISLGYSGDIEIIYGELKVSEPMATPLIREVKKYIDKSRNVILDAPPGASCPMIETVKNSDFCILVTEPTPFGLHDLKVAVKVLEDMGIPLGVVVNRSGIGDEKVYEYCEKKNIPILLEIPYQRKIAELYSKGTPFSLEMPDWREKFKMLFSEVKEIVDQ